MDKIYCIKDTNGRFEGSINIYSTSLTSKSDWKWVYLSEEYPMSGSQSKKNAEKKIEKLREINELAGFDLEWELVEFSREKWDNIRIEQLKDYEKLGRDPMLYWSYNGNVEYRDIKRGCIGLHRRMLREIYKRYGSGTERSV